MTARTAGTQYDAAVSTLTAGAAAPPADSLRADATVMGLVGLAHGFSHFNQLLLPPLFPFLKAEFGASYTELGVLLTIFFVTSCAVQAISGFAVDRWSPRPVLFAGLGLLSIAAFGFATAPSYWALAGWAVVAGIGNGVFHPVDYTLLNRKIGERRLGHAFSVHGITGSLGWGAAPAVLVPLALAFGWRTALVAAGAVGVAIVAVLWWQRRHLALEMQAVAKTLNAQARAAAVADARGEGAFAFLAIPAVWVCFLFFFLYACVISGVQAFAPESARLLHGIPTALAALCLTVYMVAAACGMVVGGFLAADPARAERIVAVGFVAAAAVALVVALVPVPAPAVFVPGLFGLMGLVTGTAGPSRDLIVKRAAPPNATGRVYGVVYSGLDIGQALAPLVFGALLDANHPSGVWLAIAAVQTLLVASAFNVRKARRTIAAPAAA